MRESELWYKTDTRNAAPFRSTEGRVVKRKHGISLAEAQEIFNQAYINDRRKDDPEQFSAIGWSGVTAWKATKREEQDYAENI